MRDYGKVHTRFWSSDTTRALTDDGRLLALYLITSPHSTIAGVFRLPDGYVCEDMKWSPERVARGFKELLANGFCNRCETTKWVWIAKHLEWNPPENPNQRKSAVKVAHGIPDECCWKLDFMRVCGRLLGIVTGEKEKPSETVTEPLPNQEQEQKQEKEHPPGFTRFWSAWPKHERKEAKGRCLEVWVKAKAEPHADRIVAHVERLKTSAGWLKDAGAFIPAPLAYLNKRKWEGVDDATGTDWAKAAGFANAQEANNAGCFAHNAGEFHNGERVKEAA